MSETWNERKNESIDLYESCKRFMIDHINGLDMKDLPMSERTYRIEHSIRVANYARRIAVTEGCDVIICTLAGILHDVGKFESNLNKDHGRVSAELADEFLLTLPLAKKQVKDICYCIAIHCDGEAGYEYNPIPEAKVVKDADSIDRHGVYRIIQALHYNDFDTMNLEEKINYCKDKIIKLNHFTTVELGTPTGTKLFNEACKIQLNYFHLLQKELLFTMEENALLK